MQQTIGPHTKYTLVYTAFSGEQERYVVPAREVVIEKLPYRIERKIQTHGVFFTLTVNEAVFLGQTARWIGGKYNTRGIQANVSLEVSVRVNQRYRSFEPKKLDFTSIVFQAKGEVKVGLLDVDFIEQLEKSKSKKVRVLPDCEINLRPQKILFRSQGFIDEAFAQPHFVDNTNYPNETPPFFWQGQEVSGVSDVSSYDPGQAVYISNLPISANLQLIYKLKGTVIWDIGGTITSGSVDFMVDVTITVQDEAGSTVFTSLVNRVGQASFTVGASGVQNIPFDGAILPLSVSVPPRGRLLVNIAFTTTFFNPLTGSISVEYDSNQNETFIELIDETQPGDTTSQAVTVASAFNQVLGNSSFVSTYFHQGCGKDLVVIKGSWIRKLTNSDLYLSFEQLFQNLSKILGLGYGYENIDGSYVVRIEPIEYFYQNIAPLVRFSLVDKYSIERSVDTSFSYSKVMVGYKVEEYNYTNAATEDFHITQTYETPLNGVIKKELKLVSDFIASGFGIRAQQQRLITQTEDSTLDEKVFIMSLVADTTNTKQDEGYSNVAGIFALTTAMNLDLSPKRNLLRHYALITSALQKSDLTEQIAFAGAERNTTLVTQASQSCQFSRQVSESSDLASKGVISPHFINEKITLKGLSGFSQLEAILANPYAPVSIQTAREKIEGFVMSIIGEDLRKNSFSLEMLEKYN